MFVAVIDDDPIFRFVCRSLFKRLDQISGVSVFEDAESAIEAWFGTPQPSAFPDVIFLDINMNVLSGWDFLDYMEEHFPKEDKPRIFIASSSPLSSDIDRAKEHSFGVRGYIIKPLTYTKLCEVIYHRENSFLMLY
jgi:CheY-like chemotaxis protein